MANGAHSNKEEFDDRKLINLARFNFYANSRREDNVDGNFVKIFDKEKLTNEERNQLLAFLERTRYVKPMSVKELKNEIFALIGHTSSNNWGTTVSRSELEAIFNWIKEKAK